MSKLVTCPDAAVFQALILGQLAPADKEAFNAHATQCPSCARKLEVLFGSPALVARLPVSRAEDETVSRVVSHNAVLAEPSVTDGDPRAQDETIARAKS